MNATELNVYALNLLLHTALLALTAIVVSACFKNPHARSMWAALGLLALAIIPCLSALHVPTKSAVITVPITAVRNDISLPPNNLATPEILNVNVRETPIPNTPTEKYEFPNPWALLASIWALGCAIQIIRQTIAANRLARWKSSLRLASDHEIRSVREQSPEIIHSCTIRVSAPGTSPCVTGCIRPTLVLPENLLEENSSRELRWALRHEARHLSGHDLRWFAVFQMILAVQWWNPFAHRLVRIWADAREQVCDHFAVTDSHERAKYGAFIVALGARRLNGTILAMANRETVTRLKRRIQFLMTAKNYSPCSRSFMASSMVAAILTGIFVSQLGVRAETPTPRQEPKHEMPVEKGVADSEQEKKEPASYPYKPVQIKISTKLFVTSTPLAPLPGDPVRDTCSEEQWQLLLRGLVQKRDTILMTAPSITALPRQNAMIEIIREGPDNHPVQIRTTSDPSTRKARAIDDPNYRFTGIRMEFTTNFQGEQIDMNCKLAYGHIPGLDPGQLDKLDSTKIPWQKVHMLRAESRALLKPTQSLLVPFGEIDPGRHLTLVVSVVPIDATGKPVGASEEPLDESRIELDETNSSNQQEPVYPRAIAVSEPPPTFRLKANGWLLDADQNSKSFDAIGSTDGIPSPSSSL